MISVEMSSDGATIDQKSEHLIASKRTPSKSLIKRSANHTDEWESLMAAISSGNKDLQLETSPASQKLMEQVEGLRQRISTSQTAPIETLRWAEQMGTRLWNACIESRLFKPLAVSVKHSAYELLKWAWSNSPESQDKARLIRLQVRVGEAYFGLDLGAVKRNKSYNPCKPEIQDYGTAKLFYDEALKAHALLGNRHRDADSLQSLILSMLAEWSWIPLNDVMAFAQMRKAMDEKVVKFLGASQIVSLYNASMRCAAASQKPLDAVQWYRLALALLQDTLPIVDDAIRAPLRLQALIRMGLSQYKSELFSEAENLADLLLQENITDLDCFKLKVKVLIHRDAPESDIRDVFKRAIEVHSNYRDEKLTKGLLSLVYLVAEAHSSRLAIECADLLNPKHWPSKNMSFETFMTAKLFLLTEGEISASAADELLRDHLQDVNLDSLTDNESSMLILWLAGDRDAKSKDFEKAVVWYKAALIFVSKNADKPANRSLLYLKSSVCYFELQKIQDALELAEKALEIDPVSARARLLLFMIHLELNDAEKACENLALMPETPELKTMLVSAAERAYSKGNYVAIRLVLKQMMRSTINLQDVENGRDLIVIIRCFIRSTEQALESATDDETRYECIGTAPICIANNDRSSLFEDIVKIISRVHGMIGLWKTEVSLKEDWEWFTKTAWNTALLADKAKLIRISTVLHEVTADIIIAASLEHFESVLKMTLQCSIEKRIALTKEFEDTLSEDLEAARASVKLLLPLCLKSNKTDVFFRGYVTVAQLEIAILGQDWETCKAILLDPAYEDMPTDILKRSSDMVLEHSKCTSEIILTAVKKTLDSVVKNDPIFNLTQFARWMRVMITHLSSSNDKACRDTFDQALAVIRLHPPAGTDEGYPKEEIEWLASKARSNQKQYERIHDEERAQIWHEKALLLSEFSPSAEMVVQLDAGQIIL